MVPSLSILFMAVAGLVTIALPVGLFLFWRRKYELKVIPLLVGAVGFIVFAMVLEQILHSIVIRPDANGTITLLRDYPTLFVLYGIFAAGVFEETARFISFKLLKRKYSNFGTSLSYGIGHGGIEAIILLGVTSIGNISVSILINSGAPESLASAGVTPEIMTVLTGTDPFMFLVAPLERIIAVAVHISLSVLVWCAVTQKGKVWLYPTAIVLHAIANLPAMLMQAGLISNLIVVEVIMGITAFLLAVLAMFVYRKYVKNNLPEVCP